MHLGEIEGDFFTHSLKSLKTDLDAKIEIFGPNSACFPRFAEEFIESDEGKQNEIAKYLASHILLKHVKNGTENSCVLENVLHFLSDKNFGKQL